MKKKTVALLLALTLVVGGVIGGTVAYLTTSTGEVKNTFTVGDINIGLAETTTDYKMVPGNTITKDPKVTVVGGSEACWLFVKVEKTANFDTFMTYAMADGWTELPGVSGVYYREVAANANNQDFNVLKDNQVTVKGEVTKTQLEAVKTINQPTLTFTAYAVQKDNIADAATAWGKI